MATNKHATIRYQTLDVSTCQDGSHACNEGDDGEIPPQIDKLVRDGKAPYLLPSLVFEVLNILVWLKDFMINYSDKDKNLVTFNLKVEPTNEINTNWIKGELAEINDKGWGRFISSDGTWSIPHYMMKQNSYRIGDELEITIKAENKTHIDEIRKL